MSGRKTRLLWIIAGCAGAAGVLGIVALNMDLAAQVQRCLALVREEGALVFFTAMAVLPLAGFPMSPFIFSAGPLFAPTLGAGGVIVCGVVAILFNVVVSYWFGAYALRLWMERLIVWLGYTVPKFPEGRSLELVLVLRLVPGVPFFVQSYLLGLARVRFGLYLIVSLLVPSSYLVAAVLAGDALLQGNGTKLAIAGGLFAVIGVGVHMLRKRLAARRALTPSQIDPDSPI